MTHIFALYFLNNAQRNMTTHSTPADFNICCKLIVPDDYNLENNPEFYKLWNEINAEFGGKCINSVKIEIIRKDSDINHHTLQNIMVIYSIYAININYAEISTKEYNRIEDLRALSIKCIDIDTDDIIPNIDSIRQHINQCIDSILIATSTPLY